MIAILCILVAYSLLVKEVRTNFQNTLLKEITYVYTKYVSQRKTT